MIEFIMQNWEYFLLGLYIIEKIVRLTPWTWDDLVIDGIIAGVGAWKNRKKNLRNSGI